MVIDDGVWSRTLRLLAAVLLVGGIGAGPLAHVASDAPAADVASSGSHAPHEVPVPGSDHPHDCPVCNTLSGATVAPFPVAPAARVAAVVRTPTCEPGPAARWAPDQARARAPPLA
jgi:hypothetical protein